MNIKPVSEIPYKSQSTPPNSSVDENNKSIFLSLNSQISSEVVQDNFQLNNKLAKEKYNNLPEYAREVIERADLSDADMIDVISTVNSMFEIAPEINENSPSEIITEDGRIANRVFEEADIMIDGVLTHVIHGIERFENYINENVEIFIIDENGEMQQTGGYGVLQYDDGTVEIHYDNFGKNKNEKEYRPMDGYVVCIGDDGGMVCVELEYDYNHKTGEIIPKEKTVKEFLPDEM